MEHTTALLDEVISFIDQLTEGEKTFGPATALLRYGREFPVIKDRQEEKLLQHGHRLCRDAQ